MLRQLEGAAMIDWLIGPVSVFGLPSTPAELLGFATGVLCVWLVVRQHIWNWPLGIANVALLMLVFWEVGLFADAGLQIVFVVLNAYGWWQWVYGGPRRNELPVRVATRNEWLVLLAAGAVSTAALWLFLDRMTPSTVPLADGLTTALSLMAIYWQAIKRLESWWLWIAADVIYIPLYGYKGLWFTAVLYVVFLSLCVVGLLAWRKDLLRQQVLATAT
jgi:nicotinamide mononucleotide transporter